MFEDINMTRWILSSLAMFLILGGFALFAKKFKNNNFSLKMDKQPRRLKVIESLYLDRNNRLFIIQKDEQEHLILVGANGNLELTKASNNNDSNSNNTNTSTSKTNHSESNSKHV